MLGYYNQWLWGPRGFPTGKTQLTHHIMICIKWDTPIYDEIIKFKMNQGCCVPCVMYTWTLHTNLVTEWYIILYWQCNHLVGQGSFMNVLAWHTELSHVLRARYCVQNMYVSCCWVVWLFVTFKYFWLSTLPSTLRKMFGTSLEQPAGTTTVVCTLGPCTPTWSLNDTQYCIGNVTTL